MYATPQSRIVANASLFEKSTYIKCKQLAIKQRLRPQNHRQCSKHNLIITSFMLTQKKNGSRK